MQTIELIHHPLGDHHPYEIRPYQRNPGAPLPDEQVEIGVLTRPIGSVKDLIIQYWIDDQPDQIRESSFDFTGVVDPEGKGSDAGHLSEAAARAGLITDVDSWKVNLPPFKGGSKVSYQVSAFNGKSAATTEVFSYSVRKRISLEQISRVFQSDRSLLMELCDSRKNHFCQLKIDLDGEDQFILDLAFDEIGPKTVPEYVQVDSSNVRPFLIELGGQSILMNGSEDLLRFSLLEGQSLTLLNPVELIIGENDLAEGVQLSFESPAGEGFYGFGERFNALNQRGNRLDTRVFEQYKNQGQRTYLPVPMLLSSRGYSLFSQNSRNTIFDLCHSEPSRWKMISEVDGTSPLKINFLLGDPAQPLQLVSRLSSLTGLPVLPPAWAFGLWISSNEWNSQGRVEEIVNLHKENGIPFTVLVLEAWSDENTFYIWNDASYESKPGAENFSYDDFTFPEHGKWPDPKAMISQLHEGDHHLLLWQIPILISNQENHIQLKNDSQTMLDNGYYVRVENGDPYRIRPFWFHDGLLMDFTHPEGRDWWFSKRDYLFQDLKIDGFKTDGGEHIWGRDLLFADGRLSAEVWNEYPNQYVGSYFGYTRKQKADGITFSRAGFSGAQAFPCHWAGDENSSWEAFRHSVLAGLNAGISGIPFWGWDIAGFSGEIPSAELYLRAAAMSVFCPIMQYHSEFNEHRQPLNDRTPWNIAERTDKPEVISIFRYFSNLRMNLIPYILESARQSSGTGLPMMRALCLVYPAEESASTNPYPYLFGDRLLISPVVEPGLLDSAVTLPQGGWFSLWDDSYYPGQENYQIPVPMDQIPVFVSADSVLPLNLGDSFQLGSAVGNQTDTYQNLCFKIYPLSEGEYSWGLEDDSPDLKLSWKKQTDDLFSLTVEELTRSVTLCLPNGYMFEGELDGSPVAQNDHLLLNPLKGLQLQIRKLK